MSSRVNSTFQEIVVSFYYELMKLNKLNGRLNCLCFYCNFGVLLLSLFGNSLSYLLLKLKGPSFLTRGYARAYHELLQEHGYANESLAHS